MKIKKYLSCHHLVVHSQFFSEPQTTVALAFSPESWRIITRHSDISGDRITPSYYKPWNKGHLEGEQAYLGYEHEPWLYEPCTNK